ncbi:MAG: hypothetical protein IPH05_12445 [Flavobacteriales bacterium]|nr:hypothetical protein [Flavobacteriales bacterium]
MRIVQEAAEQGVKVTLDKYGLYPATYYDWKRKLQAMGKKAWVGMTSSTSRRYAGWRSRTNRLKQLLAEQQPGEQAQGRAC